MSADDRTLASQLLGAAAIYEAALAKRLNEISRLAPRQALVLKALKDGPQGMDSLAKAAGCVPETVPLQALVEKSLITLEGDTFSLTGAGEELLGFLWPAVMEAEGEALAGISPEGQAALRQGLREIIDASLRVINEANPWADEDDEEKDYS